MRRAARTLTVSQKMQAVYDATTPDADGEVPHPQRRFAAICVAPPANGRAYPTWHVHDRLADHTLSGAEVEALTVHELLQEFPRGLM